MNIDLISREAAIEALGECPENWTDTPKEIEAVNSWYSAINAINSVPSVPSVQLEPLAKWIAENLDPRCGCSYCSKDRVCCDCPAMTEQQVKEELTKWMETQGNG